MNSACYVTYYNALNNSFCVLNEVSLTFYLLKAYTVCIEHFNNNMHFFSQLSLATAVSDEPIQTLTAAELNRELAGDNALSPFYESDEEAGVNFIRGSRAADSPLAPDIDVQCAGDFIDVTVEFADVYDGIIYSKGFLNDPKCK